MCSDSFGRTTVWIFTSVTSAVCSSLSAMPTHTLASSVLASPSVFDRGHIVPPPRCRRARRVGDPGDKVGQLVSIGEGLPQVMFAVVFSGYVGWFPIFVFSGFVCVGQLVVLALFPGLEDLSWSSLRTFQKMCSAVLPGLKDLFCLPSVFEEYAFIIFMNVEDSQRFEEAFDVERSSWISPHILFFHFRALSVVRDRWCMDGRISTKNSPGGRPHRSGTFQV